MKTLTLTLTALAATSLALAAPQRNLSQEAANKALVVKCTDLMNRQDWTHLTGCFAPNLVDHDPYPGQPAGPQGFIQNVYASYVGFSDWKTTIDFITADGDLVLERWTGTGTQTGPMMGIPPTGKAVRVSGMRAYRVKDGKITDTWVSWDALGLMQQLGVIPGGK